MSESNLIADPMRRQERKADRERVILEWLARHPWSTTELVGRRLGLSRHRAASRLLRRLADRQLVSSAKLAAPAGTLSTWGITAHGLAWVDDPMRRPPYEPSKVAHSTIPHVLCVQRAHLCALEAGCSVALEHELERDTVPHTRPDLVISDGETAAAVEVELTIKTPNRYRDLMVAHIKQIQGDAYKRVLYLTEAPPLADRLRRLFERLGYVRTEGKRHPVGEKQLKPFRFQAIDAWDGRP